jgi:hypothetical protein
VNQPLVIAFLPKPNSFGHWYHHCFPTELPCSFRYVRRECLPRLSPALSSSPPPHCRASSPLSTPLFSLSLSLFSPFPPIASPKANAAHFSLRIPRFLLPHHLARYLVLSTYSRFISESWYTHFLAENHPPTLQYLRRQTRYEPLSHPQNHFNLVPVTCSSPFPSYPFLKFPPR